MIISVIVTNDDLNREVFDFLLHESSLLLRIYSAEQRKTKRHKYRSVRMFNGVYKNESTIKESQVPLTEEIKKKAADELVKTINVKLWSERR